MLVSLSLSLSQTHTQVLVLVLVVYMMIVANNIQMSGLSLSMMQVLQQREREIGAPAMLIAKKFNVVLDSSLIAYVEPAVAYTL